MAGVVVVNRFVKPTEKKYAQYIEYVDREDAIRGEHFSSFDLFPDYMGNPEKSSGLFMEGKEQLTKEEKKAVKEIFHKAYEQGSLLWQTVISFETAWLQEVGLLDEKTGCVEERKLQEIASGAIRTMLEKEKLGHAVWVGSFHYNTDNLHIHVGIVEPNPIRRQKEYVQYQYLPDPEGDYVELGNGSYAKANGRNEMDRYGELRKRFHRVPQIKDGQVLTKTEVVGRFHQSSIEACKSYIVNHVIDQRDTYLKINRLLREQIVQAKRVTRVVEDPHLASLFLNIYENLPRNVDRNLWKYNALVLQEVRPMIDQLSMAYVQQYHAQELQELDQLLNAQDAFFQRAYGKQNRSYLETKHQELCERLGNAILSEIREYDRKIYEKEVKTDFRGNIEPSRDIVRRNGDDNFQTRSRKGKVHWALKSAMGALKRSLQRETEKYLNQQVYQQIEQHQERDA